MKSAKSFLSVLLILLMMISVILAGCGSSNSNSTTGSTTAAVSATTKAEESTTAPALEPVTLRMFVPGPPQKDWALVQDAINKYLKEKINASIDMTQVEWGAWAQRQSLIIASNEYADIMQSAGWGGYVSNAAKGAYIALDDLLPKYTPALLKSSHAWVVDAARVNGKIYAIPTYQMLAIAQGVYMRKDILDKYGLKYPSGYDILSVDDLETILKTVKEKEPNLTPLFVGRGLDFLNNYEYFGGEFSAMLDVDAQSTKLFSYYESDHYKNSIAKAKEWYTKGYTNKDAGTNTDRGENQVKAGKAFAFLMVANYNMDINYSAVTGYPMVESYMTKKQLTTNTVCGQMFSIPKSAKNVERALMLLDLMHTDAALDNMFVYGIEGTHYVKIGDQRIDTAPGIDPANKPYLNAAFLFGNQSLLYVYGKTGPDSMKGLDDFNNSGTKSPVFGFVFNPTSVQNEIAAIVNVINQYNPGLAAGVVDTDKVYPEFIKKLKDSGLDKLTAEKQRQIDEWLAANKK
ncbi:MAG: extracellular solute-binding protein [Ruminiclostridium sp.]|nr:extracellular solute-binding protein [Ruminiclostridium sp.]